MSGLPIFGISTYYLELDIVIVTFYLSCLRLSVTAVCVCMRMTERTTHHRHLSIFMYLSLLL